MGRKTAKLYDLNDVANLRLTKNREDVLKVLNAKKMQGEDVSEYIATAIRMAEGLPTNNGAPAPAAEVETTPAAPAPQPALDMSQVVQQVIAELARQGMVVAAGGAGEADNAAVNPASETEEVDPGVQDAVARVLGGFGDDDDD